MVKNDWIRRHKADADLDFDIIFKDDEEIHEGIKMQFSFQNQANQGNMDSRKKGG